jgi:hypothetical protein
MKNNHLTLPRRRQYYSEDVLPRVIVPNRLSPKSREAFQQIFASAYKQIYVEVSKVNPKYYYMDDCLPRKIA